MKMQLAQLKVGDNWYIQCKHKFPRGANLFSCDWEFVHVTSLRNQSTPIV